jgi:hypothetical protein
MEPLELLQNATGFNIFSYLWQWIFATAAILLLIVGIAIEWPKVRQRIAAGENWVRVLTTAPPIKNSTADMIYRPVVYPAINTAQALGVQSGTIRFLERFVVEFSKHQGENAEGLYALRALGGVFITKQLGDVIGLSDSIDPKGSDLEKLVSGYKRLVNNHLQASSTTNNTKGIEALSQFNEAIEKVTPESLIELSREPVQ